MFKQLLVLAAPAAPSMFLSAAPLHADGRDEISFKLAANNKINQCLETTHIIRQTRRCANNTLNYK